MREGVFIGMTVETDAGIPASRFKSFPIEQQAAIRGMERHADVNKVPDEALADTAIDVTEASKEIRMESEQKARVGLMRELEKFSKGRFAQALVLSGMFAAGSRVHSLEGKGLDAVARGAAVLSPETNAKSFLKNLPDIKRMRSELELLYGAEVLSEQIPLDSLAVVRGSHEDVRPETGGLHAAHEQHVDVTREIQDFTKSFLPPQWVGTSTIERFIVADKPIPMPKEYGIEGYADGVCAAGGGTDAAQIQFAPGKSAESEGFIGLASHEAAHANDWLRSNTLSYADRTALLYLVTKRVASSEHIKFAYVERIKNEDPHKQLITKVTEYWAEMMSMALTTDAKTERSWENIFLNKAASLGRDIPTERARNSAKDDLQIIRWYLKTSTPGFKPWEATSARKEFQRGYVMQAVEDALKKIPAGSLKVFLSADGVMGYPEMGMREGNRDEQLSGDVDAASSLLMEMRTRIEQTRNPSAGNGVLRTDRSLSNMAEELAMVLKRLSPYDRRALEEYMRDVGTIIAGSSQWDEE
jgi:hypothetical protein